MGVYKEGKNWKVQVYYKDWQGNRKRKQKRGFRTKGEAKEWERDFLQQQTQSVEIEFGNFLELYYKDMEVRLRENTMYTKRYIIDLKIKPYFEHKVLSEITVADIRNWQNELLKQNYSETYLKTINCQLGAIFNYAVRYYNLKDNPCRKAGSIGKSKGEPKDFWMQDEFETFLETVDDKPEAKMAFQFLYWTGMRIGEFCGLTKKNLDFKNRRIQVDHQLVRERGGKYYVEETKTSSGCRFIPMTDLIYQSLKNMLARRPKVKKEVIVDGYSNFIMLDKNGNPKVALHIENEMRWAMQKYTKLYPDNPLPRITPHIFRHTFCTNYANSGMDIKDLQYLMGHSDAGVTLN
ncbi:MAG: site-specific integrase, partial [Lachnospiraceae bacterium]|nr:site-specific integrase [Lachnospiraceae bacterium]